MLAGIVWNEATIAIAMGCTVPIVAIISIAWCKVSKATAEHDLKRRMVERGMSADEIERVMAARPYRGE